MTKQRRQKSGGGHSCPEGQKKTRSSVPTTGLTEKEIATLRNVIFGYLGFLRNIVNTEPYVASTITLLQTVYDRLLPSLQLDGNVYLPHDELIAVLEAIIGFRMMLLTCFPQTARRNIAEAEIDQLLAALMRARSLPLN